MNSLELKQKTKNFAISIIKFIENLPNNKTANVIGHQLVRSATSIGANYRSACRSRSRTEFISKITIVQEEADETLYWLELLNETGIVKSENIIDLMKEADELTAIFTSSTKTAKTNLYNQKSKSKILNLKS